MKLKESFIKITVLSLFVLLIATLVVACSSKQTPYELLDNSLERTKNLVYGSSFFNIYEKSKFDGSIEAELNFEDDLKGGIQSRYKTKLYMNKDTNRTVQRTELVRGRETLQNTEIYSGNDHFVIGSNFFGKNLYGFNLSKMSNTYDPIENYILTYFEGMYGTSKVFSVLLGLDKEAETVFAPYIKIVEDKFNNTPDVVTQEKDSKGNYIIKVKIDSDFISEILTEIYEKAEDDTVAEAFINKFTLFQTDETETDDEFGDDYDVDVDMEIDEITKYLSENEIEVDLKFVITKNKKLVSSFEMASSLNDKKIIDFAINMGKNSFLSEKIESIFTIYNDGKATTITLDYDATESTGSEYKANLAVYTKAVDDKEKTKYGDIAVSYDKISGDYKIDVSVNVPGNLLGLSYDERSFEVEVTVSGNYITTRKTAIMSVSKVSYKVTVSNGPYIGNDIDLDLKITVSADDKMPNVPKYENIDDMDEEEFNELQADFLESLFNNEYGVTSPLPYLFENIFNEIIFRNFIL